MAITQLLSELSKDKRFSAIKAFRNTLAHRLTGVVLSEMSYNAFTGDMRVLRTIWKVAGIEGKFELNENLLQVHLNALTHLLTDLLAASFPFINLADRVNLRTTRAEETFKGCGKKPRTEG